MADDDDTPKASFAAAGAAALKAYVERQAERERRLVEALGRAVAPEPIARPDDNDNEEDRA